MRGLVAKLLITSFVILSLSTMGGCCDKCINRIMTQVRLAISGMYGEVRECCTGPADQTDACLSRLAVERGAMRTALTKALGECLRNESDKAEETIREWLRSIERGAGLPPGTLILNVVERDDQGVTANRLRFFMREEIIDFFAEAQTDGEWQQKATAIVNGKIVLPEAVGTKALEDTRTTNAQPVTQILLQSSPQAVSFLEYEVSGGSAMRFANMGLDTMFEFEGTFSISGYEEGPRGSAIAIPGGARFELGNEYGSVILSLDATRPENMVTLGPDGIGVLEAVYVTKATGAYDYVPEFFPEVWLRIPLRVDPTTMAITFSPNGASYASSIMPAAGERAPDGTPVHELPCVEPDGGHPDARCRCVDTDGDGEPDYRWSEANLRLMLDEMEDELRNNCKD